jgi:hypothetical protein
MLKVTRKLMILISKLIKIAIKFFISLLKMVFIVIEIVLMKEINIIIIKYLKNIQKEFFEFIVYFIYIYQ